MTHKLTTYFQNVADALDQKKNASDIFPNPVDKGLNREGILKKFLEEHLPARCKVIFGGYIFDSNDNESSQMDLVIINDGTLQFNHLQDVGNKSFAAIEGCLAAISVKSYLDKSALIQSLQGFSSIPKMPPLRINPLIKGTTYEELPMKIIFAFSGLGSNTIKEHLESYYAAKPTACVDQVKLIIVNNKYIIIHILEDGLTNAGVKVPKNSFFIAQPSKYVGAYALNYLMTDLQRISSIAPQILLNFKDYLDNTITDY